MEPLFSSKESPQPLWPPGLKRREWRSSGQQPVQQGRGTRGAPLPARPPLPASPPGHIQTSALNSRRFTAGGWAARARPPVRYLQTAH